MPTTANLSATASAKGKVPYTYYRCVGSDAYRFGGHRVCHNKQVRGPMAWTRLCGPTSSALLRNPEAVRHEYERRLTEPHGQEDDRDQLERQIRTRPSGVSADSSMPTKKEILDESGILAAD